MTLRGDGHFRVRSRSIYWLSTEEICGCALFLGLYLASPLVRNRCHFVALLKLGALLPATSPPFASLMIFVPIAVGVLVRFPRIPLIQNRPEYPRSVFG
jgi:hypothetical protein